MEERHFSQLLQNLLERFEYVGASAFNVNTELASATHPVTRDPLTPEDAQLLEEAFLERIQYRRSHDSAVLIPVSVVSNPREHEEWYPEWVDEHEDLVGSYYWKRLEEYLSIELTRKNGADRAGRIVKSIDEATYEIMRKVADPRRREFSYKGLVVGYVQSGKTANFTALIAKAADAGYKLILVLSGIHSVLRRQTQIRLDKELTGMNDLGLTESFISEPSDAKRWNRITTGRLQRTASRDGEIRISDLGEFNTINVDPFDSLCNRSTPTIGIVKKNVSVLTKLIEYVEQSTEVSRNNMPVLIIDDEADQASIDSNANNPDADPTATNERIRTLLGLFRRKTYVGYTATPFANVLINMRTEDSDLEDDLYPRNFVVSLTQPEGYFGTSMIFRSDLSEQFVVETPDVANALVRHGQMTETLSQAINGFIISCAIRNIRGDRSKPMSMLVHVSHRVRDMSVLSEMIAGYVSAIIGRYQSPQHSPLLRQQFEEIWASFVERSESIIRDLSLDNEIPEFPNVWREIGQVLSLLKIVELNYASDDRLDYSSNEEIKVIAVGGNQLSRGLTLEGLMTSYYLRASRQYDTLLQMGRWFGYRSGYEDLTRVYTTNVIWEFFEHLALVEDELRSEIYRYEEEDITPSQMAVAIRDHRSLNVTAPNKMGAGQLRQSSFSKSLNQTIWLPLNKPEVLQSNYRLGDSFIRETNRTTRFTNVDDTGIKLARGVAGETVLNFLNGYTFVDKTEINGAGLDDESLLEYINRRLTDPSPELTSWNVALVGNVRPNFDGDPVRYGDLQVNRMGRSRKFTTVGYNIGVLTEPDHLKVDLAPGASTPYDSRSPQNPLLLLYLISKESRAAQFIQNPSPNQRIDLFREIPERNRVDVLGIALVLPESDAEPNSYFGQII